LGLGAVDWLGASVFIGFSMAVFLSEKQCCGIAALSFESVRDLPNY